MDARNPSDEVEKVDDDPVESAQEAGLRYVSDRGPGIRRQRAGKGFVYISATGQHVRDEQTLSRIKSLAIPPAWKEVWICPNPLGHLQATGHDDRGRKQYRYHPRWHAVRDENKYEKMITFALALPDIRLRVEKDLALPGLPRNKVLATIVRLLETTLIRVGNQEYAKENESFGLTTIHNKHADVAGATVRFKFKGKSSVYHDIELSDPRVAKVVRQCQDLPGYELFAYVDDDGEVCDVTSADVNAYLKEISGQDFTAKDFRTWAGTVLAAMALREVAHFTSQRQAKSNVVAAVERVAKRLGNTPAVCRKCYIHPVVLNSYIDGSLVQTLKRKAEKDLKGGLPADEAAVLRLLRSRLARESATRGTRVA